MANIARFVVQVGVGGIAGLLRGSRLAIGAVGGMASAFTALIGIIGKVTAAFGIVSAAFTAFILINARMIDSIGKLESVIGVSTDLIQKFAFAGEQTGVTFEQSSVALRRFSRRLGEAQRGTGELLPALRRLGISTRNTDGSLKSVEQVLFEFADGLKNTRGESNKLSLAFKAFDSEGAELVATLEKGSGALQEMFDQADKFGFVLDRDTIKQVENFNDSFNILVNIVRGAVRTFVGALAPALNQINKDLADFIAEVTNGTMSFKELGTYLKDTFFDLLISMVGTIQTLAEGFARVANIAIKFINNMGLLKDKDVKRIQDLVDAINTPVDSGSFAQGKALGSVQQLAEALQELGMLPAELEDLADMGFLENIGLSLGIGEEQFNKARDALLQIAQTFLELNNMEIPLLNEDQSAIFEEIIAKLQFYKSLTTEIKEEEEEKTEEVEKQLTFYEKMEQLIENINNRLKEFQESSIDFENLMANAAERIGTPIERLSKTLEDGLVKGVEVFEDTLTDAILTGKADFTALGDHIKKVLAKALVQRFITGPILAAFGLAKGGPAKAGQPYIVGEEGPELFVPNQSGTVIPNDETMAMYGGQGVGMGQTVVNYNINAVDTRSFQQRLAENPEFLFNITQVGARRQPA